MEIVKEQTQTAELDLTKYPHLQIVRKGIESMQEHVALLNNRKEISDNDQTALTPFEANERKILLLKTNLELSKIHAGIVQKEMYFKDFSQNVSSYLVEMDKDWDKVMEKAYKKSAYSKEVETELSNLDVAKFEENHEFKINFFIRIKSLVSGGKDAKTQDGLKKV